MKTTRWFALLLLVSGLVAPGAVRAQTAQEGFKHLENEQYARARAAFSALVTGSPSAENAYYMGTYYLMMGHPDSARTYMQQAQTLDARSPLALVGLGEIEVASKNLAGAAPHFEQAKKLSRNKNAEVFYRIGQAYMRHETKDLKAAIAALEKAIDLDNKKAPYYIALGDAYMLQNDASKAALNYERAGYFDTSLAAPHVRMGDLYMLARNYQEALKKYQEALALDATYAPVQRALGEIYFLAKQYDKATEHYGNYLRTADPNPENTFKYAGYLYLNKDYAGSLAELQKLGADFPNPVLHRLLGYNYYETKQFAPGMAAMETYFQRAKPEEILPSDYEFFGRLQLEAGGDTLAAIGNLHKAIEADSSKTGLYRELATMLFNTKKYPLSAAEYETMAAQGLDLSATDYLNLGKAYYFDKQYTKADSAFAFVNQVAQSSNTGWLWRARASARAEAADTTQEEQGLAKPFYEKYIELTTDTTKFKRELAEANFYLGLYHYKRAYGEDAAGTPEDQQKAQEYFNAVATLDPQYPNIQLLLEDIAKRQ